jgi:hypothetical protein
MPYNLVRLELDITGTNPSNKIVDEPHSLSGSQIRSIATSYGPFFGESVIIRDGANVLVRGSDYQIVELHQEATLRYGKEIASVILIINKNVSSNITVTYQALGGHYCYDDTAIANLYNSLSLDNRPVDWSNLLNKPDQYPPTLHRHLLDDLYGFEPVVDYLERIKNAITLGQVDVVLEVIKSLMYRFNCSEFPKVLPTPKLMTYDAFLHFLTYKKLINQVSIKYRDCVQYTGSSFYLEIDTTGIAQGTTLYWQFYTTQNNITTLFDGSIHPFVSNNSVQYVSVYLPTIPGIENIPLYAGIKLNTTDDEFTAVTYLANIVQAVRTTQMRPYLLFKDKNVDTVESFTQYTDELDELQVLFSSKLKQTLVYTPVVPVSYN